MQQNCSNCSKFTNCGTLVVSSMGSVFGCCSLCDDEGNQENNAKVVSTTSSTATTKPVASKVTKVKRPSRVNQRCSQVQVPTVHQSAPTNASPDGDTPDEVDLDTNDNNINQDKTLITKKTHTKKNTLKRVKLTCSTLKRKNFQKPQHKELPWNEPKPTILTLSDINTSVNACEVLSNDYSESKLCNQPKLGKPTKQSQKRSKKSIKKQTLKK